MLAQPTPFAEVNALLEDLLASVQAILGTRLLGMYLHGSLALGDFDPERSDIDFLVVTDDVLPDDLFAALQAMHARIAASGLPLATELEGSYIPRDALRRRDPAQARHPRIDREGRQLTLEPHDSDWVIQRFILRAHGVVLAGQSPDTLIDPVSPHDLRRAVIELVREWWVPMCDDPTRLHYPGYQAYAVLTMCRILYTLRFGSVVTKLSAARWVQRNQGKRWAALIERALTWQPDAQRDDLAETQSLIQYTAECCQQYERGMGAAND